MKASLIFGLSLCCALPLTAVAESDEDASAKSMVNMLQTTRTRQLLDLQKSGKYASRNEQKLSGKAQKEVYERYVNSFAHPIPERYIEQDFTE